MFSKEISQMTLTNDVANRLFDNITAHTYGPDNTFTATLRAVLHSRLPADESVHLSLVMLDSYMTTADIIAETIQQYDLGHSYNIYIVCPRDKSDGNRMMESVRTHIGEGKRYLTNFTVQEDLRVFYVRKLDGLFYINDNSAIIFLDYLDIRRFHALQMMIPKYLPKLFADNPLSNEEAAMLKSLGNRSSDEYERLIEQFAQSLDMRGEIIKTRLRGFETSFERDQMQKIQQLIERYERDYRNTLSSLSSISNDIHDQQIILAGLRCSIDSGNQGESELMEYFLCNRNLSIIHVSGTELEFVVHGYADVFDDEAFDIYARNRGSALYHGLGSNVTRAGMELLWRAIFESGVYKLRVCAAYRADMKNSLIPISRYAFPPESRDYLPNPHIQHYGCIGGYSTRFAEYMHKRDYVGAIDQAAVSARNLNFHDSTVMESLAHDLSHTAIKCIEDASGTLMTPREAINRQEARECQSQSESPTA